MRKVGTVLVAAMCAVVLVAVVAIATAIAGDDRQTASDPAAPSADPGALIENVPAATSVYQAHDSAGHTMDTAKIVADPSTKGRYLAVYHWLSGSSFNVGVATSTDLRHWAYTRTLDTAASQPYLAFTPRGAPILAVEGQSPSHLRFYYWTTVTGMIGTAAPYRVFDAPTTLTSCAEGTPDVRAVSYKSASSTITNGSTITVGLHYYANCDTDREAVGTLSDFNSWSTSAAPTVDQQLLNAGASGKHGDRDTFVYQGRRWTLYEGAVTAASAMGDWREFLSTGTKSRQLTIRTAKASTAFANPSVTSLTGPTGVPSLLVTAFIPSDGAAPGESGELIYWQPIA